MTVYWITFRLADETVGGRDWNSRYDALTTAIDSACSKWWIDSTSFIAFESTQGIDTLTASFKRAIASSKDLFLIREMDTKDARIVGPHNRSIFDLMPYLKIG